MNRRIVVAALVAGLVLCAKKEQEQTPPGEQTPPAVSDTVSEMMEEDTTMDTTVADETAVEETKEAVEEVRERGEALEEPAAAQGLSDMSTTELWKAYKAARARGNELREAGDIEASIDPLLQAAQYALVLGRPGIASWQYNNAAKHAIDLFKKEIDYTQRMTAINEMEPGTEKGEYIDSTKALIKEHWGILEKARTHLEKAGELDQADPAAQRSAVIQSNMSFIEELEKLAP